MNRTFCKYIIASLLLTVLFNVSINSAVLQKSKYMAKVITITQQKGGAGKTTLACHLAVALSQMSKKVAVIDVDPQGSLRDWYKVREERFGSDYTGLHFSEIAGWRVNNEILRLKNEYDYIIIDCPPHNQTDAKSAIRVSDLAIVPVQPSPNDVWASKATIEFLASEKIPFIIVFNRVNAGSKLLVEFKKQLPNVSKNLIGNRVAFAAAMYYGKTISEMHPKSSGATEIKAFLKEAMQLLEPNIKIKEVA